MPGWGALLVFVSLPLRFLEAHLALRLIELGAASETHFRYVVSLSWLVSLSLLPALWGRAVFVRAAALALAGGRGTGASPLRIPLPKLLSFFYVALLVELLFATIGWTLLPLPTLALLAGLAAATAFAGLDDEVERLGPLAPLGRLVRRSPSPPTLFALASTFTVAVLVVFVNLFALFALILFLADGTVPADLSWWKVALSFHSPQFLLLLLAGAFSFVEPFWLAALTAGVRGARAQESGEDLFARFAELRAGGAGDEEAA